MKKHIHKKPRRIDEIVLLFIVAVLALVLSFYNRNSEPKSMEAEKITGLLLDDHDISFASNGIVDENKLKEFKKMDYASLKSAMKAKNDFCIYIEDENGNIILSKGSSKFNGDGIVCRE